MKHSDQLDQLAAALAAFQSEMPTVAKTKTAVVPTRGGGEYSYSYADLADVVEAAAPKLVSHGLAVSQDPDFDGQHDLLTTTLLHSSGQWKASTMRLPVTKPDAQGLGSAITYGRRYAYCAALGIVAEEDDDGAAAVRSAPRKSSGRRQPAPPKPAEGEPRRGPLTPEEIQKMKEEAQAKAKAAVGADGEPF